MAEASATTVDRVIAIAEHLSTMSADSLQIFIDDAIQEVNDSGMLEQYKERAQRYLAAHLASMNKRRASSQSVSDVSVSYDSTVGLELDGTSYGQEYARLLRKVRKGYLRVM